MEIKFLITVIPGFNIEIFLQYISRYVLKNRGNHNLLSAWSPISVQASDGINDIRGHWAEEDLNKWMEKGILVGYQDGTIRPDNNITRAEFVTLINKVSGFMN